MLAMTTSALRCPRCAADLQWQEGSGATCCGCGDMYVERLGSLDLLVQPSGDVENELRGLAAENAIDVGQLGLEAVKCMVVDAVETPAQLMDISRFDRVQYYQQNVSAFFEALSRCQLDAHLKVLEIGSSRTHVNLHILKDFCAEAFAVNIFFHVTHSQDHIRWPKRVLADMNDLPFHDNYFDLIICSATLHHSADLTGTLAEIARILRPGGRVIVVNEPVEGIAKRLGGTAHHTRDEHIHEDPVSYKEWRRAIRNTNLREDHFIPAWFLGRLRNADSLPAGTRFRRLAQHLSPLANHAVIADFLRVFGRVPGQAVLGLPLNAVLWKPKGSPRG